MTVDSQIALDGPCQECGLEFVRGSRSDERLHKNYHDKTVNGHKTKLPPGCHVVTHRSAISLQRLTEWAASEARYETKYDFSSFNAVKKSFDEDETIAVISVMDGRVIALIVTRERECNWKANLDDFSEDHLSYWRPTGGNKTPRKRRRAVDMIWVLRGKRGQGEAGRIVQALVDYCQLSVDDLAHLTPLQGNAKRVWEKLGISTVYLA